MSLSLTVYQLFATTGLKFILLATWSKNDLLFSGCCNLPIQRINYLKSILQTDIFGRRT